MIGQLPKLFDRDFAVGYFLPAALFLAATLGLLNIFTRLPYVDRFASLGLLGSTAAIGLISLLIGVILQLLNLDIYRLFEGYGDYNPFKWRHRHYNARFLREAERVFELRAEQWEQEAPLLKSRQAELDERTLALVEHFPDNSANVLPTEFGNTIRAFERYPAVIYGIDAIPGWYRLLGVMPKEYRQMVDGAKSQTDFWLNTCLLSGVVALEALVLGVIEWQWLYIFKGVLIFIISVGIAIFAMNRAIRAAVEWGNYVKAAFDLFLPSLAKVLGLKYDGTFAGERGVWQEFSAAMVYRMEDAMPERTIRPDGDGAKSGRDSEDSSKPRRDNGLQPGEAEDQHGDDDDGSPSN